MCQGRHGVLGGYVRQKSHQLVTGMVDALAGDDQQSGGNALAAEAALFEDAPGRDILDCGDRFQPV